MRAIARIDGQEINDPINLAELRIKLNYLLSREEQQVSINDWELGVGDRNDPNDGAVICLKRIESGLNGGIGLEEGLPFSVDVEHGTKIYTVFDGILDLGEAIVACNKVTAPAIDKTSIDFLTEKANGFSFERLYEVEKSFTSNEFIPVPYVISTIPDAQSTILCVLSLFVVANEIKDQIQSLAEYVSAASNPFTANIIIAVILRVAYIILLLAAIIKFLKDLFNCVIQPVKYHMGMYAVRLLQIGADHLGLKFKSSIFDTFPFNKMVIIPEKNTQKINDDTNGVLGYFKPEKNEQLGYYKGTFGKLLLDLITLVHGKIIVKDGFLMLERSDFKPSGTRFVIPSVTKLNGDPISYRFNKSEMISNYVLKISTDLNDKNTRQQYEGSLMQVQTSPINSLVKENNLIKNLKEVSIPFALVKTKKDLTFPEKIFDSFFKTVGEILNELVKVVNKLIKLINKLIKTVNKIIKALKTIGIKIDFELKPLKELKAPTIGNLISNRLGMMLLENDFIEVPKMVLLNSFSDPVNNKAIAENSTVLNAVYLWDNFHFVESMVPSQARPNGNQYHLPETITIPFTFQDYETVRASNDIITEDGEEIGEIDSLEWNVYEQTADITYRISKLWTRNIKETRLIPNGQ